MEPSKKDCCKGDREETSTERMNYFTGRHLAACDFEDEQKYHRTHRFLHNRMLHGWGVVCGLEVKRHEQPGCENRFVKVSPGLAIDCCGREIIVDHAACCGDEEPEIPWKDYSTLRPLLMLCLAYDDIPIAQVPVLSSEGDCSNATTTKKYARSKESSKLSWHWVAKSDLKKYSWSSHCVTCPKPGGDSDEDKSDAEVYTAPAQTKLQASPQQESASDQKYAVHEGHQPEGPPHEHHPQVYPHDDCPHDDCGDPCKEGFRSCLAAKCPPEHCVPLAVLCVDGKKKTITKIIMNGRPEVPHVPQRLTHIVDINWPHGGMIPTSWFEKQGFVVTFDRKLREPDEPNADYPGPYGVNQATFIVESGEGSGFEDLDYVRFKEPPTLSKDRLKARYSVAPDRAGRFRHLANHVIWIRLKCDFLLDCHGVRVDGDNNGVPGGTFESWVYVLSDADYYQQKPADYDRDREDDRPSQHEGDDRNSDADQERPRRASDMEPRRIEGYDRRAPERESDLRRRNQAFGS